MKSASTPTAETIRRSLGIYTDPDAPLFRGQGFFLTATQFLLRSACLSLEVFLHGRFGKRYLTIPKLIASVFFPAVCLFLTNFDFDLKVGFSFVQPGFVELIQPNAERLSDSISDEIESLQFEWKKQQQKWAETLLKRAQTLTEESEQKASQAEMGKISALREAYAQRVAALNKTADETMARLELEKALLEAREAAQKKAEQEHPPSIFRRSVDFLKALVHRDTRKYLLAGLSTFIAVFGFFANLWVAQVYLSRISGSFLWFTEAHPHSSGEPCFLFNPLYRLAQRLNAKTDMVKQFAEPLLCYLIGAMLKGELPPAYSFVSTWLKLGAFLLFVRMYLENKNREKLHLDRLANKLNSEALQLQNSLFSAENPTSEGPVQVQGK